MEHLARRPWSDVLREGGPPLHPALHLTGLDRRRLTAARARPFGRGSPPESSIRPPIESGPVQWRRVGDRARTEECADRLGRHRGVLRSTGTEGGLGPLLLTVLVPGTSIAAVAAAARWRTGLGAPPHAPGQRWWDEGAPAPRRGYAIATRDRQVTHCTARSTTGPGADTWPRGRSRISSACIHRGRPTRSVSLSTPDGTESAAIRLLSWRSDSAQVPPKGTERTHPKCTSKAPKFSTSEGFACSRGVGRAGLEPATQGL